MSNVQNLKELIPKNKQLSGITISDLFDTLLTFEKKTLIMFDLETLGLNPSFDYEQITEVASFAVCGNTRQILNTMNYRVDLVESAKHLLENPDSVERYNWDRRQKRRGKTAISSPAEILKFTKYHEINIDTISEELAIRRFYEFVSNYENPVLVAHNAEFDVNYVSTRGNRYDLKLPTAEVLDTLSISRFFFIPALQTLTDDRRACELISPLTRESPNRLHISSRLGDLATAFNLNSDNWHTASADVSMMNSVMWGMLDFLTEHKTLNINKYKDIALAMNIKKYPRRRK